MKKIVPALVLLCLFASIVAPISADEGQGELPSRDGGDNDFEDYPDNLVMPDEWGEVVILSNPETELWEEDDQRGYDEEPLISPFDPGYDTNEFIGIEGDMDGDGVPDEEDACPTVPGDDGNGCPSTENGGDAELISPNPNSVEEDGGFPLTMASVLAGAILAVIVVIGMTVRRKR